MSADAAFEEPILRLRRQIEELSAQESEPARQVEIDELREKLSKLSKEIYSNLTPWQKTLVARHPLRPYTLDYIAALFEDFTEIHGDRKFADDAALVAGFGRFHGQPCAIIGHQKGRTPRKRSSATSASRGRKDSARHCA